MSQLIKWFSSNGETLKGNLSISEYTQGYETHSPEDEKADFLRRSSNTILNLSEFKPPPLNLIHSERKIATTIF